jgi:hypothetical protein
LDPPHCCGRFAIASRAQDQLSVPIRELPWQDRFDAIVNWFTAFGYFDDPGNRRSWRRRRPLCGRAGGSRWR